jgi:hypothetical protein
MKGKDIRSHFNETKSKSYSLEKNQLKEKYILND